MRNDSVFGSLDKPDFGGNTILLEFEYKKYVFIGGYEITEFTTHDKILDYISIMGNIMTPQRSAVEKKTHISYQLITNLLKTINLRMILC